MRMGFSLNDWIDFWMGEFNVRSRTYFRNKRIDEPIAQRYQRMLDEFSQHGDDVRMQKLERRVFGARVVEGANQTYWIEQGRVSAKVSPLEWAQMPLEERGRLIAFVRVESMTAGIRRYVEAVTRRT